MSLQLPMASKPDPDDEMFAVEPRIAVAKQIIQSNLWMIVVFLPMLLYLRQYLLFLLNVLGAPLGFLWFFLIKRSYHREARLGLLLTSSVFVTSYCLVLGYESKAHLMLLSHVALAFLLFTYAERRLTLVGATVPALSFVAIETNQMLFQAFPGTLTLDAQRQLSILPTLVTCVELVVRLRTLFQATARSESRLREARNRALEASRIKSQFLANMSHELRTPMNGILGMISLLKDSHLDGQQREQVNLAERSASSLMEILSDLLDVTRMEHGRLAVVNAPFSMKEVLDNVVGGAIPQAHAKRLELRLIVETDLPPLVRGDRSRLGQILSNLLGNAVKFTEQGSIELHVSYKDDRLEAQVRDTGVGISQERLPGIFEPFTQGDGSVTRRFGGLGLGLTISRELARRMGGDITVQSTQGQGSTFCLTSHLPREATPSMPEQEKPAQPTAQTTQAVAAETFRILVAEDNPLNAKIAIRLLEKLGHQVAHVEDGSAVLRRLHEEIYDVIFMDVQMPEMDGLEATRQIRLQEKEKGGHVQIIALTANAMPGDEEICLQAGMDAYLSKPINAARLQNKLELVRRTR